MGVPKFAAWLTKKYPAMVSAHCPRQVHGLYVDLNGMIHPCCHDEDDPAVALRPDAEKIECICREVERLVLTVRPKNVLYIATDGVAPRAKMNQQRARRYTSVANHASSSAIVEELVKGFSPSDMALADGDLDDVRQELMQDALYGGDIYGKESFNDAAPTPPPPPPPPPPRSETVVDVDGPEERLRGDDMFDSNCISPGTAFMAKVANAIREMVETKIEKEDIRWATLHVVLSTDQTPGEGEHKIIDFLRTQSSHMGFNGQGAHVIVGLDADLIFLTLSLHIPHIWILRDNKRRPYAKFGDNKKVDMHGERVHKSLDHDEDGGEGDKHDDAKGEEEEVTDEDNASHASGKDGAEIHDRLESFRSAFVARAQRKPIKESKPFEYYDMDLVGSSIVSELNGLCHIKSYTPASDAAFNPEELISSGGYHFYRHAGDPKGEMRLTLPDERRAKRGFQPCTSSANSKIIDDFIVLAMLMGNDFLPRIPSVFCGESAMDNLMEIYVSEVLPHGFLTAGNHEIDLVQLRRLFVSYAKIETMKFRQYAISQGIMTKMEAATPLHSPVDERWRQPYLKSTGLAGHVETACARYVEGLRFVWRYYSATSSACSWSWYYPFHHGPFALDVADYLRQVDLATLPPPPLEQSPPDTFVQLLCILPPTSRRLLPRVLGKIMLHPPEDLHETFPLSWKVDHTAAYNKDHLAVVMIPFADAERLRLLVAEHYPHFTPEERALGLQQDYHIVMHRRSAKTTEKEKINYSFPYGDLRPLQSREVTWKMRKDIIYESLRDTAPERSRPRTYSSTAAIPWVTAAADGRVNRRERRPRRERRMANISTDKNVVQGEPNLLEKSGVTIVKGPSFAEYLIGISVAAVVTTFAVSPLNALQTMAVCIVTVSLAFALGIAVLDPARGSGIRRNNIRMTYVDWLCEECLSINFSRNEKCFLCCAPFDAHRCHAVFAGKQPPTPPLMDPDHTQYMETVNLELNGKDNV